MLTLQCVGASAGSLEGLGTEASQAHVHHGNSIQSPHPGGTIITGHDATTQESL